ncbi:MAG: hypothetical protein HKN43_01475 [Rhodothermales bacterium]|nr:hypothetical protein [Rhodothermales bacterium]
MTRIRISPAVALTLLFLFAGTSALHAQDIQATRNVTVEGLIQRTVDAQDGQFDRTLYLALSEDPDQPLLLASPSVNGQGVDTYRIRTDGDIELVASAVIADLPATSRSRDVKLFYTAGAWYAVVAVEHSEPRSNSVAAVIYRIGETGPREVRRITTFEGSGFIHLFPYKHSSGKALLFTAGDAAIHVYDLDALVQGDANTALVATIDSPAQPVASLRGFRDVFVGFEPALGQDRMYTAGAGGYYVYDVTNPVSDSLLAMVNPAGILYGHKVVPEPNGNGVLTAADYRTAPLRFYDLRPVFDGNAPRIRTAVGAWTANWCNFAQQFEFRWPYAFVASMEDGFQMVNMRDHENPYTSAYARTNTIETDCDPNAGHRGAYDVEVRNRDGLIAVGDLETGIWLLRVEDFKGWDGHGWGIPDVSTVQDWENGPDEIGG